MVDFDPDVIIFTTNVHPKYWFREYAEEDRAPLLRRLTEIKDFSPPPAPTNTHLGGVRFL